MKGDTWTRIEDCPLVAGVEPESIILVWHSYQGAMAVPCSEYGSNRFFTHWRRVDAKAWISRKERLPGKEDSDAQNCVVARNTWGEVIMAGWHRIVHDPGFTHWQHPPDPPRIANQNTGRTL